MGGVSDKQGPAEGVRSCRLHTATAGAQLTPSGSEKPGSRMGGRVLCVNSGPGVKRLCPGVFTPAAASASPYLLPAARHPGPQYTQCHVACTT